MKIIFKLKGTSIVKELLVISDSYVNSKNYKIKQ
jgi:hypothetical protein